MAYVAKDAAARANLPHNETSNRKKLVAIATALWAEPGPHGADIERILGHLTQQYDVTVIVPTADLRAFEWTEGRESEPFREILASSCGERTAMAQFLSELITEIATVENADAVIHFHPGSLSDVVATTVEWLDLPLILMCRGAEIETEIFGEHGASIRLALEKARAVFVPNRSAEQKASRMVKGAHVHLVTGGLDLTHLPFANVTPAHAHPKIGLFAETILGRDVFFLLETLDFDIFDLQIAGSIPEGETHLIRSLIEQNSDLSKKIEFTRFPTTPAERVRLFEDVDVVCSPSRHASSSSVVLEAMSVGRLVVASASGPAAEIITHGQNGFLYNHDDADELGAALGEALMCLRTERQEGIRRAARETVEENHSSALEGEFYLAILEATLKGPAVAETSAEPSSESEGPDPQLNLDLEGHAADAAAIAVPLKASSTVEAHVESDEVDLADDESFVFRPLKSLAGALDQM
jgi:glycosyltransferase involved in cell wall biosynthesis